MITKYKKPIIIFSIFVLSLGLRVYAANTLQIDYDEPVYLNAALKYTKYIREAKYTWLAWDKTNFEHPPFFKILYGVALLSQKPIDNIFNKDISRLSSIEESEARPWIMLCRYISVGLSAGAVLILSFFNPLSGLILGVDTLNIKYSSVVYLEALPLLTSLLSALWYLRWIKTFDLKSRKNNFLWLGLSATCLGISVASKYVFGIVGVAIVIHFILWSIINHHGIKAFGFIALWGAASIILFFLFDPYLWPHPIERLVQSLTFHATYPTRPIVKQYNYPFWQPLIWLSASFSTYTPATNSSFIIKLDTLISFLALIGLPKLFKNEKFYFVWLFTGLITLILWPTKWPQYTMILMVPLSISAAKGIEQLTTIGVQIARKLGILKQVLEK